MTTTIAVVSGGMDSTVLAYLYRALGHDLTLVSFDYGQRHARELDHAALTAAALVVEHVIVDLRPVGAELTGSALTDPEVDVPLGHYEDETMRATVVPNRNAILLNVAIGIAVARQADQVGIGVHAGDHAIYPDCRPEFVAALGDLARVACEGFIAPGFVVDAPFVDITKADIARLGADLGVPWEQTWSCYQGGTLHCGQCGTCVERREAFELAGVVDPTRYEGAAA